MFGRGRYFTGGEWEFFIGWGYQDFTAGTLGTSVTLTANENGDSPSFSGGQVIGNSAVIVQADTPARSVYTGSTRLFSSKVAATNAGSTTADVTLSGTPHSSWGDCRIYYFYQYQDGAPANYIIPSKAVAENLYTELQSLFITEEELGAGSKDGVFNSIENTPIGATTPSTGAFTTVTATYGNILAPYCQLLDLLDTFGGAGGETYYCRFLIEGADALTQQRYLKFDIDNEDWTLTLRGEGGAITLADWFDQSVKTTANDVRFNNISWVENAITAGGTISANAFRLTGSGGGYLAISDDTDLLLLEEGAVTIAGSAKAVNLLTNRYIGIAADTDLLSLTDQVLTVNGGIWPGTLRLSGGTISDTTGAISFSNENLTTTGNITATNLYATSTVFLRDPLAPTYSIGLAATGPVTANRTITFSSGDSARTITLSGNPTLNDWFDQSVKTTASPTLAGLTTTGTIDASGGKTLVTDNATTEPDNESDGYVGVAKVGGQARLYFEVEGTMYYISADAALASPTTGNPIGLLMLFTYV